MCWMLTGKEWQIGPDLLLSRCSLASVIEMSYSFPTLNSRGEKCVPGIIETWPSKLLCSKGSEVGAGEGAAKLLSEAGNFVSVVASRPLLLLMSWLKPSSARSALRRSWRIRRARIVCVIALSAANSLGSSSRYRRTCKRIMFSLSSFIQRTPGQPLRDGSLGLQIQRSIHRTGGIRKRWPAPALGG